MIIAYLYFSIYRGFEKICYIGDMACKNTIVTASRICKGKRYPCGSMAGSPDENLPASPA